MTDDKKQKEVAKVQGSGGSLALLILPLILGFVIWSRYTDYQVCRDRGKAFNTCVMYAMRSL
jgi:hypothetical protein